MFSLRLFHQSGALNLHFEVRRASEVRTHEGELGEFLNTGLAKICSRKTLDLTLPSAPPPPSIPHAQFGLSPALF